MNAAGKSSLPGVTFPTFRGRIHTCILPFFYVQDVRYVAGGRRPGATWLGAVELDPERSDPMTKEPNPNEQDRSYQNSLYPEDQEKVDAFLKRGVNSVERKPFRPGRLLVMLVVVVLGLSLFSQWLARWAGIY